MATRNEHRRDGLAHPPFDGCALRIVISVLRLRSQGKNALASSRSTPAGLHGPAGLRQGDIEVALNDIGIALPRDTQADRH
jgi:hypothetical protein